MEVSASARSGSAGNSPFITAERPVPKWAGQSRTSLPAGLPLPGPRRPTSTSTPGELPRGARQPGLELPRLAALGKDIKPCQIFCSHSQSD